jgi:hypothetical protein
LVEVMNRELPPDLSDQALEDGLAEVIRLDQKAALLDEMGLRGHMELDNTPDSPDWLLTGQETTLEEEEPDAGEAKSSKPRRGSKK